MKDLYVPNILLIKMKINQSQTVILNVAKYSVILYEVGKNPVY